VEDGGCEIADGLQEDTPFVWAGASSEGEPQIQEDEVSGWYRRIRGLSNTRHKQLRERSIATYPDVSESYDNTNLC
jgi:hypothetical protein